jgi:hypothetical protein
MWGSEMGKILSFGSWLLLSLTIANSAFAEPAVVTACETVLRDRLGTDTDYMRIGFNQLALPLGRAEFEQYMYKKKYSTELRDTLLKIFDSGEVKPHRYSVFLNYTISNTNDLREAATAKCEYVTDQGREDQVTASSIDMLSIAKFPTAD